MEVRHVLAANAPVNAAIVARIVDRLDLPQGSLGAFFDNPSRSSYQQAFCGEFGLQAGRRKQQCHHHRVHGVPIRARRHPARGRAREAR